MPAQTVAGLGQPDTLAAGPVSRIGADLHWARGMTGKLAAGSGPSVPPVVSITCLGSGLARGGAAGLRFNYARLSLDAVQVGPPFRTDYSTQPEAGGDPSERDRSEPKLGTKHVEAVVLIWQPAAD